MDKPELIRTIREAHKRVEDALRHISDARLLDPVMDDWTGKDLLAHLTSWHDHSALVVDRFRAGREPYDNEDPANSTDERNEQTYREHLDDAPEVSRRGFTESFARLLATLEPVDDDELFAADRWPWLGGEALAETILWDTSRHYNSHRETLERLTG